jgi:hypothetical protein
VISAAGNSVLSFIGKEPEKVASAFLCHYREVCRDCYHELPDIAVAAPSSQSNPLLLNNKRRQASPIADHTVTQIRAAIGYLGGTNEVILSLTNDANGLPGTPIRTWVKSLCPTPERAALSS